MGAGEMKEYVKLSEVCNIIMGQSPESNSYNELGNGLPFFQGNADFGELYPVTKMWCTEPKKIVEKNTLLISVRAPIGALNFSTERCCIGRGLAGITAKAPTDLKYIYYGLMNKKEELNRLGTGSTFKAINKKVLKNTLIVKEKAERQHNIVKVLDKNILIIAHLQKQLYLLDELVKSRFVEMFGDPISNPKRWDTISLGNRCKIITGNTPSRAESENYGNFIEWIKSDNINTPFTLLTNAQECLSEIGFQKCRFVEAGSLLMTCIAGSINCIGNVAISNRRVAFNQQINAIVPEEDEVLYLYWLMLLSKPIIHHTINKSLKGILSKGQLSEISFPFPPREIQKQFVAFATQIDKSRLLFKCQLLQYHNIQHIIRGRNYG